MSNSDFGIYSGEELFGFKSESTTPIIQDMLHEKDHCIIVGREKVGKSILTLQMAMCIASGEDFLDTYEVPTPLPILYVQTEGKVAETADRIRRMGNAIAPKPENFGFCFEPSITLDTEGGYNHIITAVNNSIQMGNIRPPRVIFIDPVYSAISGDFNDNECVKHFVNNLKRLGDKFAAAIVMVHHQHKTKTDDKGRPLREYGGDSATGSAVFSYHVDMGYTFSTTSDKVRHLHCYAHRTTKIPDVDLILVDSDALYFTIQQDSTAAYEIVKWHLGKLEIATIPQLMVETHLSRDTVNKALRYFRLKGVVERIPDCGYPIQWRMKK